MTQLRKKTEKRQQSRADISLHTNLTLVRTPNPESMQEVLRPQKLRKKVIRFLDERSFLVARSSVTAIRKRLRELNLPETLSDLGGLL